MFFRKVTLWIFHSAVSKIASECYCKGAFTQHDVPVNVIRPFNIYGPDLNLAHGEILTEVLRVHIDKTIHMKMMAV